MQDDLYTEDLSAGCNGQSLIQHICRRRTLSLYREAGLLTAADWEKVDEALAAQRMGGCARVLCPLTAPGSINEKNRPLRELAEKAGKLE